MDALDDGPRFGDQVALVFRCFPRSDCPVLPHVPPRLEIFTVA